MLIDSSLRPIPPLNGDVSLVSSQGPGHYEELDLDYVDWTRDPMGRIVFACHDTAGNVVKVRIRESIIEDIMFPGCGLHHPATPPDWVES